MQLEGVMNTQIRLQLGHTAHLLSFSHISHFLLNHLVFYLETFQPLSLKNTDITLVTTRPQLLKGLHCSAMLVPNIQPTFTLGIHSWEAALQTILFSQGLSQGSNTAWKPPSFLKLGPVLAWVQESRKQLHCRMSLSVATICLYLTWI